MIITTIAELQSIEDHLNYHYVLGNDIDASATTGWTDGPTSKGFVPISLFIRSLDGQGHKITNLYQLREGGGGLFETIGTTGRVKNLELVDVDITSNFWAGALCWKNKGTTSKCSATGSVVGCTLASGGFCGDNEGEISDCYTWCRVTAALGACGFCIQNTGTLNNCYSATPTLTSATQYGFCGNNQNGDITHCYWDKELSGVTTDSHTYEFSDSAFAFGGINYDSWVGYFDGVDMISVLEQLWAMAGDEDIDCALINSPTLGYYTVFYEHSAKDALDDYLADESETIDTYSESIFKPTDGVYDYQGNPGAGNPSEWLVVDTYDDPPTLTQNGAEGKTTSEMWAQATFVDWSFTSVWQIVEGVSYPTFGFMYYPPLPPPLPVPPTPTLPYVGIYFAGSYIDVSADMMSFTSNRGRQNEMNRCEAGTATIVLSNLSGNYWPDSTTSDAPYCGNIKPLRRVRITAQYAGSVAPIFDGVIESWHPGYIQKKGQKVPIMTLSCVDDFKGLSRLSITLPDSFPSEYAGQRINRILDLVGFPLTGYRQIDTGIFYDTQGHVSYGSLQALTPITNLNVLQHIQDCATARGGKVFMSANGAFVFHDGGHYTGQSHVKVTDGVGFGEAVWGNTAFGQATTSYTLANTYGNPRAAGEYPYDSIDYLLEDQYIYNDIHCTIAGGIEQVVQDATSISTYGQRSLSKTGLLLTTDGEARVLAQSLLALYKDPVSRFRNLVIIPASDPANLYPAVYFNEIGQIIRVRLTEANILSNWHIEGIAHSWDAKAPQMWSTTWQLSKA